MNTKDQKKKFASKLRKNATSSEKILWQELQKKKLGVKFRRQVVISRWVADFCCTKKKLVVELDGKYHLRPGQPAIDSFRDKKLNDMGYRTLRIDSSRVFTDLTTVMAEIDMALNGFIYKNKK